MPNNRHQFRLETLGHEKIWDETETCLANFFSRQNSYHVWFRKNSNSLYRILIQSTKKKKTAKDTATNMKSRYSLFLLLELHFSPPSNTPVLPSSQTFRHHPFCISFPPSISPLPSSTNPAPPPPRNFSSQIHPSHSPPAPVLYHSRTHFRISYVHSPTF